MDDVTSSPATSRRVVATHRSQPLSWVVAQMLKASQNFYAEMLIKAVGRTPAGAAIVGSTEQGRQTVRQTLDAWQIPRDALVMHDGSGLSRYNYASAHLLTGVLRRMWQDERHRGPFAASLPVAGHDGTVGARMTGVLKRRVQAKTGTISNVRSLAGYAETDDGEKLVFAMIANHFIAPNVAVDEVMEAALERLLQTTRGDR
jgi:D-alanyl-D-alanine carboxypeptidase/D-alanyl-D-alanine-endopeptidase (penicillin-binding protein 4)